MRDFLVFLVSAILILGVIAGIMFGLPKYNVYRNEMAGRAEMARAEQNRQIKIEEAKANLEAEKLNAQAEVERAKGASEAMKIEGGSLSENYIKYLWVRNLDLDGKQIIYVPTEAGIPLLEAGRVVNR